MPNLQADDLQVYWQGRSIKERSAKVVMINRRNHQYAKELNQTISSIGTAEPKENLSKDEMIR